MIYYIGISNMSKDRMRLICFVACIILSYVAAIAQNNQMKYYGTDDRKADYSLTLSTYANGSASLQGIVRYYGATKPGGYRPSDWHISKGGWKIDNKIFFTGSHYSGEISIEKCPKPNFEKVNYDYVFELNDDGTATFVLPDRTVILKKTVQ